MAFFNYSNMQMTAKIVYYGPGLCGKTTNLQFIHAHTTEESRGEMVSLETQTDRTLFFDLLPIEVGTVAGFKTKIQLYTVPGQVFYNTTRKLVLKGVDGVVFVADSQQPMLQANQESLANLEENLLELGIAMDKVPLVLQYNKRDLDDIASLSELESSLNRHRWSSFQSSAITGTGVFETLRGISKVTLLALKKQLETTPSPAVGLEHAPAGTAKPLRALTDQAPAKSRAPTPPPLRQRPAAAVSVAAPEPAKPRPSPPPPVAATAGGHRSAQGRNLLLTLGADDYERARRILISLRVQDEKEETLGEVRDLRWDIERRGEADELVLRLNISLSRDD